MTAQNEPLDEVIHQRSRLAILTTAKEARRVEFGFLQDSIGLTAGNLSRHLKVLEEAGMVTIEKGYTGRRARTWVAITRRGSEALQMEIDALREIVERVEKASNQAPARTRRSSRADPAWTGTPATR